MGDKPTTGPIVIGTPPDSGDSGGSSGGSSGGGSSEPKVDPIVARRMALFQSIYTGLWGEPATEAYVKSAANAGLNSWEFAARERAKPEFSQTETYKKKAQSLAELLGSLGAV